MRSGGRGSVPPGYNSDSCASGRPYAMPSEYCLAAVAMKSLEYAPLPVAHALARGYARLLDRAIPRLRRVARRNLALALPGIAPEREREIIDGVFRSIARILVSFAKFPSIRRDNLARWIRLEGGEHFEAAHACRQGRPVRHRAPRELGAQRVRSRADGRSHERGGAPAGQSAASTPWWSAAARSPATGRSGRRISRVRF